MGEEPRLKFGPDGLIPAVVQDGVSGEVLMVAFMDEEALRRTLDTGLCTYWSRSRGEHWVKGATSGNLQRLESVSVDCDQDALLLRVRQTGAACHEGYRSCFFRELRDGALVVTGRKAEGG